LAQDLERLVVQLSADIKQYERAMQKAVGVTRKQASAIEKRYDAMGAKINKAFAGFVAGLSVGALAGVISSVRDISAGIAEIGASAERAGVSNRVFQELAYVAEQTRVPIDALTDGLKEMNLRGDEFAATGKGSAAEAFARLGYGAEELKQKLAEPNDLFLEIIGRLEKFDKAAQIRIADEVFGGEGGERFVQLLDEGEDGIRRMMTQAHDLGRVMDDELIAKAAELDRQFSAIVGTVGTALKTAIVNASSALSGFINSFREFNSQQTTALEGRVNDVIAERAQLLEKAARAEDLLASGGMGEATSTVEQQLSAMRTRVAELTAQEDEIIGILQERNKITPPSVPGMSDNWTPPAYVPPPAPSAGSVGGGGGGGGGGGSDRADDWNREVDALLRRTEALKAGTLAQAEINPLLQDYGRAAEFASARTDLLLAAQQAGVAITPQLRASIAELASSYADAAAASGQLDASQDKLRERAEEMASLRRDVFGGFAKDMLESRDAADALANALGRIGDRMIDLALNAAFSPTGGTGGPGGGLGAILSSVGNWFGGARAGGGPVSAGKAYVVGEKRPELFVPNMSGRIIPSIPDLRGARAGAAAAGAVDVRVSVDRNGELQAYVERTAGGVAARVAAAGDARVRREVPGILAKHQLRNG
jgi:hypothetical protein